MALMRRLARNRFGQRCCKIQFLPAVVTKKRRAKGTGCARSHFQTYKLTCYVKLTLSQRLTKGCDYAKSEASCEARAHNPSRRRDGARCGWTGSFADGGRISIHDTHG